MALQGGDLAMQRASSASTSCSYFLTPFVQDVQLSEKDTPGIKITCVELWGLYIWLYSQIELSELQKAVFTLGHLQQKFSIMCRYRLSPRTTHNSPRSFSPLGFSQPILNLLRKRWRTAEYSKS